jgi:ribosomal protein S10
MAKPLKDSERQYIYNQFITKLMEIDMLNSDLESIKKMKVMIKLYKDTGMEFKGELPLPHGGKIFYELYKDHRRKTRIDISNNINKPLAQWERNEYYTKVVALLKKMNVWNSKDKEIQQLKKDIIDYKEKGKEFNGTLQLPNGEAIMLELYNNHLNENVIKVLGESDLLTYDERNATYKEIIQGLKNIDLFNSDLDSIKQLKKICKEYRDNGTEASGELPLPSREKIVYELCKDHSKKSIVKISDDIKNFYGDENIIEEDDDEEPELFQG